MVSFKLFIMISVSDRLYLSKLSGRKFDLWVSCTCAETMECHQKVKGILSCPFFQVLNTLHTNTCVD